MPPGSFFAGEPITAWGRLRRIFFYRNQRLGALTSRNTMELLTTENLIALLSLTALEIVLGIDNIIFISIMVGKLPAAQREKARIIGLALAMITRIGLLFVISRIVMLTDPLFTVLSRPISGRDLILLGGGLFLLAKATHEIHNKLEGPQHPDSVTKVKAQFMSVVAQILIIDIVFSLDSVITAVGMVKEIKVMIAAIVIAVVVMLVFAKAVSDFVEKHPTLKMLALSFLLLVGVLLVAEGLGQHIERSYVYFAMAFSLLVEVLNIKSQKAHAK